MKKLMRQSIAAAGFAALLLSGACAHTDTTTTASTDSTDQVIEVNSASAETSAAVDVTGNQDRSPIAPDTTPVTDVSMTSSSTVGSSTSGTTTTIETTTVPAPMTSSVQESTSTTTTEETTTRTRMRKD